MKLWINPVSYFVSRGENYVLFNLDPTKGTTFCVPLLLKGTIDLTARQAIKARRLNLAMEG